MTQRAPRASAEALAAQGGTHADAQPPLSGVRVGPIQAALQVAQCDARIYLEETVMVTRGEND